jgi:hypothetical protein
MADGHIVGRCIVNGQPCVYVARKIGDRVRVDCLLESEVAVDGWIERRER